MEVPMNSLSEPLEVSRAGAIRAVPVTSPACTTGLRHLFGPVVLCAALSAIVIFAAWIRQGKPVAAQDRVQVLKIVPTPESTHELEVLLDYQLKNYRADLEKFTWS